MILGKFSLNSSFSTFSYLLIHLYNNKIFYSIFSTTHQIILDTKNPLITLLLRHVFRLYSIYPGSTFDGLRYPSILFFNQHPPLQLSGHFTFQRPRRARGGELNLSRSIEIHIRPIGVEEGEGVGSRDPLVCK